MNSTKKFVPIILNSLLSIERRISILLLAMMFFSLELNAKEKPWEHGRLTVDESGTFLRHEDGTTFFWLGDTGWLLPQRLNRDEAAHYLKRTAEDDYNVVLVQVLNGVPSFNAYGQPSHVDGWNLTPFTRGREYDYWDHLEYIIDTAASNGIYIGMVCIWGGLVKGGLLNESQAKDYGSFLANRFGDKPNIIWVIGGDIQGNIKTEVWDALATSIKSQDPNHLMTFHPRGRTTSARWFNSRPWLDFNMYQSGHRRYDQRMGNKDYPIPDGTEEDVWMYVDSARMYKPIKPVLDGEPSYEGIPQGLHDGNEPLWTDKDVRRYAYWGVFAGSCGHTYGHNNIMQFIRPGIPSAYFADGEDKPWWKALNDPGRGQIKYLKHLMGKFSPKMDHHTDSLLIIDNGKRYDRKIGVRGEDYALIYSHIGGKTKIDANRISEKEKNIWLMNPVDGSISFLCSSKKSPLEIETPIGEDAVIIVCDNDAKYLDLRSRSITEIAVPEQKDLTE